MVATNSNKNISIALKTTAGISYVIACFLPVFKGEDYIGITALARGWIGILDIGPIFISWLANIFFFMAFLPFNNKRAKLALSIFSVVLGISFLSIKKIPVSEGGQYDKVQTGVAFYFWIFSFLALAVSNFIEYKKSQAKA